MDNRAGISEERGDDSSNDKSVVSEVIIRDYDPDLDATSLKIMFKDFWGIITGGEMNLDSYIDIKEPNGREYRMNRIDGEISNYIYNENSKIKVAEHKNRLVGFMVYHYIFDCIIIVRGSYFVPEYRGLSLLPKMTLSVGHVSKVISQYDKRNLKRRAQHDEGLREVVHEGDQFYVYIDTIRESEGYGKRKSNGRSH